VSQDSSFLVAPDLEIRRQVAENTSKQADSPLLDNRYMLLLICESATLVTLAAALVQSDSPKWRERLSKSI
jgi:hypothetical protein